MSSIRSKLAELLANATSFGMSRALSTLVIVLTTVSANIFAQLHMQHFVPVKPLHGNWSMDHYLDTLA